MENMSIFTENMSIFTRTTNLTPAERACAVVVKGTMELIEKGALTKLEGSMRIWGARDVLMSVDPESTFWREMIEIEQKMMK